MGVVKPVAIQREHVQMDHTYGCAQIGQGRSNDRLDQVDHRTDFRLLTRTIKRIKGHFEQFYPSSLWHEKGWGGLRQIEGLNTVQRTVKKRILFNTGGPILESVTGPKISHGTAAHDTSSIFNHQVIPPFHSS